MKERLWFKRKLYGWGWQPSTWEGWLVTSAIFSFILYTGFNLTSTSNIVEFYIKIGIAVFVLIGVCFAKGEKPRWQWGKRLD